MSRLPGLVLLLLMSSAAAARPTLEEVRAQMGIASSAQVRGQRDAVGYATTPEGMAKVWELAGEGPKPESFGATVAPGVIGVVGPHDDYVYAARVYREVFPLVTARTVVVVGVFHRYRTFEARDQLVFDPYRAWRSPDGEIAVSPLRDELFAALPPGMAVKDAAAHDSEHSIEGIAYFLKHARRDVEIVPVIVPAASFERFAAMASSLGTALAAAMKARGWQLGRDVAIVVSTDGVHYGEDFKYAPYGAGGIEAFKRAMDFDRGLVHRVFDGPVGRDKARAFFTTVVDEANPDRYRVPWCGRFSVTLGTMLVGETARALGMPAPRGVPLALGVSVDTPELAVRALGIGPTAPANLHHFVTHPAVAFVPGG
jgi:AmmeMemoRadiSam system protein B